MLFKLVIFLSGFYLLLQMLEDFVDVSSDEKDIMHLWNSFVRKQRYFSNTSFPISVDCALEN